MDRLPNASNSILMVRSLNQNPKLPQPQLKSIMLSHS